MEERIKNLEKEIQKKWWIKRHARKEN